MNPANRGFWFAIGAYASWGVFPLYWKLLRDVPAIEVISHRILWSFLMLVGYLAVTRQARVFRAALATPDVLRTYAVAAMLIAVNWLGFIWAVNAGFIVETSLGYFINPLLSVLLGVFVIGESLRPGQWFAVALAASGVVHLTISHGELPWISLLLATSFAFYGLVKKRAPLGAVHGLTLETGLLVVPAMAFLAWNEHTGQGAFAHAETTTTALLLGAGLVTTLPLLMFASAAQSIPLVWIGIFQYIAPTLQLAIAVFVYDEPFARDRLIGFSFVWAALVVFAVDGIVAHRTQSVTPPPE